MYSTRFIITTSHKDKILNPIISRFCNIHLNCPNYYKTLISSTQSNQMKHNSQINQPSQKLFDKMNTIESWTQTNMNLLHFDSHPSHLNDHWTILKQMYSNNEHKEII